MEQNNEQLINNYHGAIITSFDSKADSPKTHMQF